MWSMHNNPANQPSKTTRPVLGQGTRDLGLLRGMSEDQIEILPFVTLLAFDERIATYRYK